MKQSSLGLGTSTKRTRRREFLDEMDRVVPWSDLVAQIAPFMPEGKRGRPPFPVESLLRIHFMQQWFTLSDPAMEEALHDVPLFRDFAGLGGWDDRLPDESTILRFRHVLEKNKHVLLGEYQPNRLDRTDHGPDPITKPEPLVIAIGKAPISGASTGMCTPQDPFGIADNHGAQKSLFEKWLKDMPAHGTRFDYNRLLDSRETKTIDTHEYVVVAEVLASEIQPQVRAQLDQGVAVQALPEKVFSSLTAETALTAASTKLLDALLESAWKESAGYIQEHWKQYRKIGMTVRIEKRPKGKYAAIFKANVAAQKISGSAAKQITGAAASSVKPKYSKAKLGSGGAAFIDGGFAKTGKTGYGGAKRIFLNSAKNFKSGMKIQIIGTVVDLYGDMTTVFGENGSKDLSEFLGRAGVTLIKAGTTAVLGSLFAAGVFMGSAAVAGAIGVAAVPVAIVVTLVVIGYILSATLVELIDTAVDGKERVASWVK